MEFPADASPWGAGHRASNEPRGQKRRGLSPSVPSYPVLESSPPYQPGSGNNSSQYERSGSLPENTYGAARAARWQGFGRAPARLRPQNDPSFDLFVPLSVRERRALPHASSAPHMDDFENAAAAGENTGGKFVQALPPARRERIPAPAANGHNRPAHRLEIARPYPYRCV